jgi:hypothetical protein
VDGSTVPGEVPGRASPRVATRPASERQGGPYTAITPGKRGLNGTRAVHYDGYLRRI